MDHEGVVYFVLVFLVGVVHFGQCACERVVCS